jgi:hypothetical protein
VCGGDAVVDQCDVCGGGNADMDCAGVCGGDAVEDCAGICGGDTDPSECIQDGYLLSFGAVDMVGGTLEIIMNNELPVAGFQFNISGLDITDVSGGSSEEAGFMVSTSATTVLGFSLSGAEIPASNGVLVNVSFENAGDEFCLLEPAFSDGDGFGIDIELGACYSGPNSISNTNPSPSEKAGSNRQNSSPAFSNDTFTRTPLEAGISAPESENPSTVVADVETMKPASSEEPPETSVIFAPEILNWKPATASSLFIIISNVPPTISTAPKLNRYPS